MKHTKCMAIGTLLLLGVSAVTAQSLGDYARTVRKNKPDAPSTSRHFDNDNLPTDQTLSVVGPPVDDSAASKAAGDDAAKAGSDPKAAAAERQKAAEELKAKLDKQKEKIDALNHELDLDQRELRLHQVTASSDPTIALRSAQFGKDVTDEKNDIEAKQKAIAEAQQQMQDLQDQAHKAGIEEKDNDKGADKDKDAGNK
jgi:hypothetical protein